VIAGTIPQGQNSPRCVRFGLYAEQMTASAFVAPRHLNKKAWLYRARPAVAHQGFVSSIFYYVNYDKEAIVVSYRVDPICTVSGMLRVFMSLEIADQRRALCQLLFSLKIAESTRSLSFRT
jgi:homogentisate 1,2-dioxygenase